MTGPSAVVGFIGLGNMGNALATNLVQAGHQVVCHDALGPDRAPEGARHLPSVADVARAASVVVLSLPDGRVSKQVAHQIASTSGTLTKQVVDTSTVGVEPSVSIAAVLRDRGIGYVDAPVSGGVAGARARTLTVMHSGTDADVAAVQAVLEGLSDRRHRVGDRPGLAQAVKLANNFLAATALAATSEAVAFGISVGLDMAMLLEVVNGSSGRSAASSDKFPEHVLTGSYASGFAGSLMSKDVQLYLRAVEDVGGPLALAPATASLWQRFADTEPQADFTRIYPFVQATATSAVSA